MLILGDNLGLLLAADVAGFAVGPLLSALVVGPLGLGPVFDDCNSITLEHLHHRANQR